MRAAHLSRHHAADLRTRPRELTVAFYRLGGILLAVGISSAFWLLALVLASNAAGFTIGTPALTVFGLAIAALCFVALAALTAERR